MRSRRRDHCALNEFSSLEGAAEGTDRWAVEHGWVSITLLRLDLTDEADLARGLALSDTPATKISGKRRQRRSPSSTFSSKSKSSKGQKYRKRKRKTRTEFRFA